VRDVAGNGFNVTLKNVGTAYAPPSMMLVSAGSGDNPYWWVAPVWFGGLNPGEQVTLRANAWWNVIGEYTLYFSVDHNREVTESNEANNTTYYCGYLT